MQELIECQSKELEQKTAELIESKKKLEDVSAQLRNGVDSVDVNQNIGDLQTKLSEFEIQHRSDAEQIKSLAKDLNDKFAELAQLKDKFDAELVKHAEESALLVSDLNNNAHELVLLREKSEADQEVLLSSIGDLEKKLQESEVQQEKNAKIISSLNEDLESKTSEMKTLEAKLSSVAAQNLDLENKVATLAVKTKVEPFECKCEKLTSELETVRLQLSSQLEAVTQKLAHAEQDLETGVSNIASMEEKLIKAETEIASRQAEVEKFQSAENSEVAALRQELSEAINQRDSDAMLIVSLTEQLDSSVAACDKLRDELQERMSQRHESVDDNIAALEEKIVELEIKIEEDALVIKSQSEELIATRDLCKQLEDKLSQTVAQCDLETSRKVSSLENELEQVRKVFSQLKEETSQHDAKCQYIAECDKLKSQVSVQINLIEKWSEKNLKLVNSHEELFKAKQKDFAEYVAERNDLKSQVAAKCDVILSLEKLLSEKENIVTEMEFAKSKMTEVESQKFELETKLQDLEKQLLAKESDKSTSKF